MGVVPRLEKVISSKISLEDFQLLEELARQYFFENKIKQPTISHIVRAYDSQLGDEVGQATQNGYAKIFRSQSGRSQSSLKVQLACPFRSMPDRFSNSDSTTGELKCHT